MIQFVNYNPLCHTNTHTHTHTLDDACSECQRMKTWCIPTHSFIFTCKDVMCMRTGEDATPWLMTFSTTNVISSVDPMLRNLYTVSLIYSQPLQCMNDDKIHHCPGCAQQGPVTVTLLCPRPRLFMRQTTMHTTCDIIINSAIKTCIHRALPFSQSSSHPAPAMHTF